MHLCVQLILFVNFIINFILLSKKNITFTNEEINSYFYNNNKGIIKINEKIKIDNYNTYLSLIVLTCDATNCYNNTKLLFEYADKNNIILDLNNHYDDFYDFPLCAVIRGRSIKRLKSFIEYADKNNIVLELNNKFNSKSERSPIFEAGCFCNNIDKIIDRICRKK